MREDLSRACSPEALARARYAALAMKRYDFLLDTTHGSHVDYQAKWRMWTFMYA